MRKGNIIALIIIGIIVIISIIKISVQKNEFNISHSGDIGILSLEGVIIKSDKFISQLKKYGKSNSIKGIIIEINSPGGSSATSQEIFEMIKWIKNKYKKPIFIAMKSVAASGGYYVAIAADSIFALPSTLTGSIGVIMDFPQWEKALNKIGVEMNVIKSGKLKDSGSPYRDFTESDKKYFQSLVNDVYEQFIEDVSESRNIPLEEVRKLANGQVFTGKQAYNNKLIDKIGTTQNAIDLMAQKLKLGKEPKIVKPKKEKMTLIDILFGDIKNLVKIFNIYPTLQTIYN
ncbi:MAG: signal peptide peptidase SppA [Candidatus Marinimicrobia bacterium]|nr:signal peptide peptidase SppA [Candidatus Neomarinimicrobiota bacterium]